MTQKKTNYWDRIFTAQNQNAEGSVPENDETSPLDFLSASASQEQERHVREILFSEDSDTLNETADAVAELSKGQEMDYAVFAAPVSEVCETENCEETAADEEDTEEDFFGWTQTTKTYTHLSLEGREPELTEEPEGVQEETAEQEECVVCGECCGTESAEAEEVCAADEVCAEEETAETASDEFVEDPVEETPAPVLSEDGFLCRVLDRYERPVNSGFGFGLLDEEESEETSADEECAADELFDAVCGDADDAESEECEETAESEGAEVLEKPEGLDPWDSLAFDLGIPVAIPEKTAKKEKAPAAAPSVRKDCPAAVNVSAECGMADLEDDDFVSPENVFEEPKMQAEKKDVSRRSRRDRGRRNAEEVPVEAPAVSMLEEAEEVEDSVPVPTRSRRRRRSGVQETVSAEEKSAAIGGLMAGVVASKMQETEKAGRRSGRKNRAEEEEAAAAPARRERTRRNRRPMVDEMPEMEECVSNEMDLAFQTEEPEPVFEEEREVPNGARSRRRRRSQREKMERCRMAEAAEEPVFEEELDEMQAVPRKRSRRDTRNRFDEFEDDFQDTAWQEPVMEEDEDEEEEREPRSRRQRRSRRSASERDARYAAGRSFEAEEERYPEDDEEDHVFTEVCDDADEDDEEWETDFSQHDVPGWRYTIDFIVNTNLKARRREPSSLAGSINRMAKRGGKRK